MTIESVSAAQGLPVTPAPVLRHPQDNEASERVSDNESAERVRATPKVAASTQIPASTVNNVTAPLYDFQGTHVDMFA